MHPNARGVIHVLRLTTPSLTDILTTSKIRIIQTSIQSGCGLGTGVIIPLVVLIATVVQLHEHVVHRIVGHVLWFVSIVDATFILPFPVRIPERSGTNSPFVPHADVEVPSEVCGATFVQGGAQVITWVGRHVARFGAIVLASKACWGPVWVKQMRGSRV